MRVLFLQDEEVVVNSVKGPAMLSTQAALLHTHAVFVSLSVFTSES